ncbi:MAG: hypothetical protein M1828_004587 [Chrysothrix sp. TS-e1954]|nr:MAG: hypothetical protein M1828_004587 [Chrysothrix sp. TS-e1954]
MNRQSLGSLLGSRQGRRAILITPVFLLLCIVLYFSLGRSPAVLKKLETIPKAFRYSDDWNYEPKDQRIPTEAAGNATLGFQGIFALTRNTPWRVHGLLAAAAYTGLEINTPPQPDVSADELDAFQSQGEKRPGDGSALAWMAHLNLLREVQRQRYQTALILEDDADWDISIRWQMKRVSAAVRWLTAEDDDGEQYDDSVKGKKAWQTPEPYGHAWDVLWIGNCGEDVTGGVEAKTASEMQAWRDSTVIPNEDYDGWAHNSAMLLQKGTRAIVRSRGPICSFAYAVTMEGAAKVVELAGKGSHEGFDTKLSELCKDKKLRCISVFPEVMHEYVPPEGKNGAVASEVNSQNRPEAGAADAVAFDEQWEKEVGTTKNIVDSARCKALFGKRCLGK